MLFAKLQVIINLNFEFSSDLLADHPRWNQPYLPHMISKQGVLLCVEKLTMQPFFWFWSQIQKPRGSSCVIMTRCCVPSFGPCQSLCRIGLKAMLGAPSSQSYPNPSSPLLVYTQQPLLRNFGFIQIQFSFVKQTSFTVIVATSPFTVIHDPCFCSSRLWQLVLSY